MYDKAGLIEADYQIKGAAPVEEPRLAKDYYLVYSPKGEFEECSTIKEARALRLQKNDGRPSGW